MRIGFTVQYAGDPVETVEHLQRMEGAGLDIAWVAEAYGFDAPSILGYIAASTDELAIGSAILNIYSRTPATLAQTAAGLDAVSGGRFELGLGASGPQVIEGWHGIPYDKPLTTTEETIDLVRRMLRREVIEHDGEVFTLPLPDDQGLGLGKPLKILTHPVRDRVPIHVASMGPQNVAMTAEHADGWIPMFFDPDRFRDIWGEPLTEGLEARSDELGELDTIVSVAFGVAEGEHRTQLLDASRSMYALYIGGMGSKEKNFYNDMAVRYGYEEEAAKIQELYLDGQKDEAAALVPEELIENTNLIGSEEFIKERIAAYEEAGVTTLNVVPMDDPVTVVEQAKAWTA